MWLVVISLLTTPLKGLSDDEEEDVFRAFRKLEVMENPRFAPFIAIESIEIKDGLNGEMKIVGNRVEVLGLRFLLCL